MENSRASFGGAINIGSASEPKFYDSYFRNCSAFAAGGGIANIGNSKAVFEYCEISSCTADSSGGGVYGGVDSSLMFRNSIITFV